MTTTPDITTFEKITKAGVVSPTILNGLPGMSSLEIAEITGKRHDNVLRDITKMLTELDLIDGANDLKFECIKLIESQYRDARGRLKPLVVLNKELTFTLLSRYSFKLSNLIVKRWLELEGSGFERVSVQTSVVHLVEREKDNYREAMRALRRSPQCQSPAAKALRSEKAERAREAARMRRNRTWEDR
jgi:phage regulator Rha-like protein